MGYDEINLSDIAEADYNPGIRHNFTSWKTGKDIYNRVQKNIGKIAQVKKKL